MPNLAAALLFGVNLSGAELGAPPGMPNHDYIFPDTATLAHFAALGLSAIRLPVLWERLQPRLDGGLDVAQLAMVDDTVTRAAALHLRVIIDLHDYGRWNGHPVGSAAVPDAAFAGLWGALAQHFATHADTVVFGLMNEPHDMPAAPWARAEQAAIDAIRAQGARNLILASGVDWDGAHNFVSGSNAAALAALHDPAGNTAIEMHQYLDADFSGTHTDCMAPAAAAALLAPATSWLKATHHRGFLGEFAASRAPDCLASLDALLATMDRNPDVWIGWTYWAAGAWWGDYMFSVQPKNGLDAPQMAVLRRHIGARS